MPSTLKRPLTAYFFFAQERRKELQSGDKKLSVPEIGRSLGKAWAELEDKSKYQELAQKDRERYKTEYEKLKSENLPLPTRRKIKHRKKPTESPPEVPETQGPVEEHPEQE